jgi:hypothetical protein
MIHPERAQRKERALLLASAAGAPRASRFPASLKACRIALANCFLHEPLSPSSGTLLNTVI